MSTAYSLLEKRLFELLPESESQRPIMPWHSQHFRKLMHTVSSDVLSGKDPLHLFEEIRKLRGVAVHRQHYNELEMRDCMLEGIDKVEMLLNVLGPAPTDKPGSQEQPHKPSE